MAEEITVEAIARRLKNQYTRPQLNDLARNHYRIADPVGYRTQDQLIEGMISANTAQAAIDAGFTTEPQEDTGDVETSDEGENTPDAETAPESDAKRLAQRIVEMQRSDHLAVSDDADSAEPEPEELPEGVVLIVGTGTGNRVAFWERHRDHPNGEVFLRGGQTGQAALTADVQRAVKRGRVRLVDGK